MAQATPDARAGILGLSATLAGAGGKLVLSDLFRSYQMQMAAHEDYVQHRKKAYSPPPGGSFHEAGRAFDLDLSQIKIPLRDVWGLAAAQGFVPIVAAPDPGASEAWHFEHRGSHQLVYDYYKAGKGGNFKAPDAAAAASAIVAIGVQVDIFGSRQAAAYVQSALIRLGFEFGDLDGAIGPKTRDALTAAGFNGSDPGEAATFLDAKLKQRFPGEFA